MQYPIKAVSNITGLSIHVIRAWEKRYSVVTPRRTETNRRLYSSEDVEKLKLLSLATEKGYAIGSIASLDIVDLKNIAMDSLDEIKNSSEEKSNDSKPQETINSNENIYLSKCVESIKELNVTKLEKTLYKALVDYPQLKFIDEIIAPLLEIVGNLWKIGEIRILHEHISTAVIRKFLTTLIDNNSVSESSPSLLIATPKGQLHELGALIIGAVASSDGWNVTYMGPDLPGEEIAAAIDRLNPNIVALSIVYPSDDFTLDKEMLKLKKLLNKELMIIAGGRSANSYKKILKSMGARVIITTEEFRTELENYRNNSY